MIFIILFGIVAIIVISLNFYDASNLEKIKEHFVEKECSHIIYSKGTYKGICEDEIIQIDNSFTVDLNKKRNFKFSKINKLSMDSLSVIINDSYKIEFKDKKNQKTFYKKIEEKINK